MRWKIASKITEIGNLLVIGKAEAKSKRRIDQNVQDVTYTAKFGMRFRTSEEPESVLVKVKPLAENGEFRNAME